MERLTERSSYYTKENTTIKSISFHKVHIKYHERYTREVYFKFEELLVV